MQYLPQFPIPIWFGNIENNDELKEVILPYIDETKDSLEKPKGWVTDKVITSFANNEVNASLFDDERKKVEQAYWTKLDQMFENEWSADMLEVWYNYYTDGEWQEKHTHINHPSLPRSDLAVIHFLSWKNDEHISPVFYDPLEKLKSAFANPQHFFQCQPNVNEGDFIVFPSYLEHSVDRQPYTPDYPRITISFNLRLNKY